VIARKRTDKGRLPPFVPLDQEVMASPAWRATSFGARWLYVHLKRRWSFKQKNNGRIFLSQRDAQKEMGTSCRDSISRWFRELQHYGFIVMTDPGGLGVDGKGKAPHWQLTELEAPGGRNGSTWMLPTKDFLRWNGTMFRDDRGDVKRASKKRNPGPETWARVARKQGPGPARKQGPLHTATGPEIRAIPDDPPGPEIQAISRYTTPSEAGERSAPPWCAVASSPADLLSEYGGQVRGDYLLSCDSRACEPFENCGRPFLVANSDPKKNSGVHKPEIGPAAFATAKRSNNDDE
jgi:hypothetical protein